jgi:GT2 family glycosyltransferase
VMMKTRSRNLPAVHLTLVAHYPISAGNATPQRIFPILDAHPSRGENPQGNIALLPARDVEIVDGRTVATSEEPWMKFADIGGFEPGGFVEITYRASLFDDPVRPVLRFRLQTGEEIERFLPGPVAGAAIWVGRVPRGTIEIWISPTRHRGRFDFVVERVRRRNWLALWLEALQRSPRYALSAAFYGVPAFVAEYDMNLDWALGFTPIEEFAAWRKTRARAIDLTGIDAPRSDWANAPAIHVVVVGTEGRDASLQSLREQIFGNWQLHDAADLREDWADDDLVFVLRAGDRLEPQAFACAIEHAARHPAQRIFYADEIEGAGEGAVLPALKPDWSPLLQAVRPYLGSAVFARVRLLRSCGRATLPEDLASAIGWPEDFPAEAIGHLRRMLLIRGAEIAPAAEIGGAGWWAGPVPSAPAASIIIPTKDGGDLLQKCVASIFAQTSAPDYHIVVVDNGSTTTTTGAVLARLAADPRVTVLSQPGPFNFAGLCNAGAAAGSAPVLVFLNDDTVIRSPDWLARLSFAAARPEIGAVGAKLIYPDGTVQHAGIAVGIGETAGHFGAGSPESAPGWLGRHSVPYEVAAVTGACLTVERRKFDAVDGFDSANLPIELNDVDLCLRLGESGWKTVCFSQVSLFHEESASRGGAKFRLLKVHQKERAHFTRRWRRIIRDDPFFHPAFSLFRRQGALC